MTQTILVWRDTAAGRLSGSEGLRHWRQYSRRSDDELFTASDEIGQIAHCARVALEAAMQRGMNVVIGWGAADPGKVPAVEIEAMIAKLWPITIFARERDDGLRWVMSCFGESATFAAGAISSTVFDFCKANYPQWQPGAPYRGHALILRHDATAEELGLIEPHVPTPDDICSLVASDPEVAAATVRLDRASPQTWHRLVHARLKAQAARGIAEDQQAPLYSSQVDEIMVPIMMRLGRGDEAAVVAHLRRECRVRFGDLGEKSWASFCDRTSITTPARCSPSPTRRQPRDAH
jgi:hypothetical protein